MRLLSSSLVALLLALSPTAGIAAPTTSQGQISVAQVIEMATLAPSDANARMTVVAYLAGLGETAGLMVSLAEQRGAQALKCSKSFGLDVNVALAALTSATPNREQWAETPATPIIIADLFRRADCH